MSAEDVRCSLGSEAELELQSCPGDVCVPVVLPDGANRSVTLDTMVAELERIARLIDPYGPTYRESRDPCDLDRPRYAARGRGNQNAPIKFVCWNIATMHQP